ncbi:MAG: hypothetical protein HW416_3044, partial [Chloroflexi bacterium]|nr:hypothetical protein [Chloroflexota bacterium]
MSAESPRRPAQWPALAVLAILLSACAPAQQHPAAAPSAPRLLTLAIQVEPNLFNTQLVGNGGPPGGRRQPLTIAHDYLVVQSDKGVYEPRLAREQISAEKGTWRVNPDGSMETMWTIRPNIKWQDGTPFTSADIAFTFAVYSDPEVLSDDTGVLSLMRAVEATDPLSFVIHWSTIYAHADEAPALDPLPLHLLDELYRTDKANFDKSPRFRTDFIGLGPY